jgi:hypothetical protein
MNQDKSDQNNLKKRKSGNIRTDDDMVVPIENDKDFSKIALGMYIVSMHDDNGDVYLNTLQ